MARAAAGMRRRGGPTGVVRCNPVRPQGWTRRRRGGPLSPNCPPGRSLDCRGRIPPVGLPGDGKAPPGGPPLCRHGRSGYASAGPARRCTARTPFGPPRTAAPGMPLGAGGPARRPGAGGRARHALGGRRSGPTAVAGGRARHALGGRRSGPTAVAGGRARHGLGGRRSGPTARRGWPRQACPRGPEGRPDGPRTQETSNTIPDIQRDPRHREIALTSAQAPGSRFCPTGSRFTNRGLSVSAFPASSSHWQKALAATSPARASGRYA